MDDLGKKLKMKMIPIKDKTDIEKELGFKLKLVKEGKAMVLVPHENKVSKKMPVFYNPIMKHNRDITIALLKQYKPLDLCDPLAATGIRAIRFAKELKYKSITINDINPDAYKLINMNLKINDLDNKSNIRIHNKDANQLFYEEKFDYLDLDVFGSPVRFLASAISSIRNNGIIAITATDTGALCGTFTKACIRKYGAKPLRVEMMHELGLRILIKRAQDIGAMYDKALYPIYAYAKEHYMRVFFRVKKGKRRCDELLSKHKFILYDKTSTRYVISDFNYYNCYASDKANENISDDKHKFTDYAGPLWVGALKDKELSCKIAKTINDKFTNLIANELDIVGFYALDKISSIYKKPTPKLDVVIEQLRSKGIKASRTHFYAQGLKTTSYDDLIRLLG